MHVLKNNVYLITSAAAYLITPAAAGLCVILPEQVYSNYGDTNFGLFHLEPPNTGITCESNLCGKR